MEKRYQSEGVVKGRDMVQTNMVCDTGMFGVGVIMLSDGSMYSGAAQVRLQVT